MANLKRHTIELVKEVKEGEVVTETFITPPFIPFSVVYEATDLMNDKENDNKTEREMIDLLLDFVANKIYKDQFTKEQLQNGLHAPDAMETLQDQVMFVAQGKQNTATLQFLAKKR